MDGMHFARSVLLLLAIFKCTRCAERSICNREIQFEECQLYTATLLSGSTRLDPRGDLSVRCQSCLLIRDSGELWIFGIYFSSTKSWRVNEDPEQFVVSMAESGMRCKHGLPCIASICHDVDSYVKVAKHSEYQKQRTWKRHNVFSHWQTTAGNLIANTQVNDIEGQLRRTKLDDSVIPDENVKTFKLWCTRFPRSLKLKEQSLWSDLEKHKTNFAEDLLQSHAVTEPIQGHRQNLIYHRPRGEEVASEGYAKRGVLPGVLRIRFDLGSFQSNNGLTKEEFQLQESSDLGLSKESQNSDPSSTVTSSTSTPTYRRKIDNPKSEKGQPSRKIQMRKKDESVTKAHGTMWKIGLRQFSKNAQNVTSNNAYRYSEKCITVYTTRDNCRSVFSENVSLDLSVLLDAIGQSNFYDLGGKRFKKLQKLLHNFKYPLPDKQRTAPFAGEILLVLRDIDPSTSRKIARKYKEMKDREESILPAVDTGVISRHVYKRDLSGSQRLKKDRSLEDSIRENIQRSNVTVEDANTMYREVSSQSSIVNVALNKIQTSTPEPNEIAHSVVNEEGKNVTGSRVIWKNFPHDLESAARERNTSVDHKSDESAINIRVTNFPGRAKATMDLEEVPRVEGINVRHSSQGFNVESLVLNASSRSSPLENRLNPFFSRVDHRIVEKEKSTNPIPFSDDSVKKLDPVLSGSQVDIKSYLEMIEMRMKGLEHKLADMVNCENCGNSATQNNTLKTIAKEKTIINEKTSFVEDEMFNGRPSWSLDPDYRQFDDGLWTNVERNDGSPELVPLNNFGPKFLGRENLQDAENKYIFLSLADPDKQSRDKSGEVLNKILVVRKNERRSPLVAGLRDRFFNSRNERYTVQHHPAPSTLNFEVPYDRSDIPHGRRQTWKIDRDVLQDRYRNLNEREQDINLEKLATIRRGETLYPKQLSWLNDGNLESNSDYAISHSSSDRIDMDGFNEEDGLQESRREIDHLLPPWFLRRFILETKIDSDRTNPSTQRYVWTLHPFSDRSKEIEGSMDHGDYTTAEMTRKNKLQGGAHSGDAIVGSTTSEHSKDLDAEGLTDLIRKVHDHVYNSSRKKLNIDSLEPAREFEALEESHAHNYEHVPIEDSYDPLRKSSVNSWPNDTRLPSAPREFHRNIDRSPAENSEVSSLHSFLSRKWNHEEDSAGRMMFRPGMKIDNSPSMVMFRESSENPGMHLASSTWRQMKTAIELPPSNVFLPPRYSKHEGRFEFRGPLGRRLGMLAVRNDKYSTDNVRQPKFGSDLFYRGVKNNGKEDFRTSGSLPNSGDSQSTFDSLDDYELIGGDNVPEYLESFSTFEELNGTTRSNANSEHNNNNNSSAESELHKIIEQTNLEESTKDRKFQRMESRRPLLLPEEMHAMEKRRVRGKRYAEVDRNHVEANKENLRNVSRVLASSKVKFSPRYTLISPRSSTSMKSYRLRRAISTGNSFRQAETFPQFLNAFANAK